ncbi:phosphatidylcholine:ceramide cholinephosphotransferase 2-like isoform X3 [Convolutriloba macropyga]|uniref:phosphatidylcholine:ceramide cholinephosphotransferase 2-like isoform X3 n=1 Tax=Convolutriloba macropyga TaxID=536237 RepID=UPI003F521EE7
MRLFIYTSTYVSVAWRVTRLKLWCACVGGQREKSPLSVRNDAPVLYDSILSVIPKHKVAGKISEVMLFTYQVWFIFYIVFQRRRFALARRCLAIQSVCFIFRIICVWANVLPRSTYTMECSPKATGTAEIIKRILLLWSAAGLSIFGGHMCGNYFFSGHALMATIIYHHLAHYMPAKWWVAHKLNLLVGVTIATLILFAHNHYTLDIVGSVIVGNWVCKLYIFIAENKDVNAAEWFPVFWRPIVEFFERDKEKVEYEFGGVNEFLQFLRFASNLFFNKNPH